MPFFNCECYHKWGRPNDLLVFVFQALIWMSFVKVSTVCSTFCSWILLSIITVGPLQCVISNIMVWFLCHQRDYNPSKLFGTPLDYFVKETGEFTLLGKEKKVQQVSGSFRVWTSCWRWKEIQCEVRISTLTEDSTDSRTKDKGRRRLTLKWNSFFLSSQRWGHTLLVEDYIYVAYKHSTNARHRVDRDGVFIGKVLTLSGWVYKN